MCDNPEIYLSAQFLYGIAYSFRIIIPSTVNYDQFAVASFDRIKHGLLKIRIRSILCDFPGRCINFFFADGCRLKNKKKSDRQEKTEKYINEKAVFYFSFGISPLVIYLSYCLLYCFAGIIINISFFSFHNRWYEIFDRISQFRMMDHKMNRRGIPFGDHRPFSFVQNDLQILKGLEEDVVNDNSDVNRQKFLPVFSAPDILHSSLVCYLEKTYRTVEEKVHEDKNLFR